MGCCTCGLSRRQAGNTPRREIIKGLPCQATKCDLHPEGKGSLQKDFKYQVIRSDTCFRKIILSAPVPVGFIPLGKEAMLGSRAPAGKGAGFEANEPDEVGKGDGFLGNGARFPPREPVAIRKESEFMLSGWPVFRTGPPCGPRELSNRPRGGSGARVQGVGRSLGKIRGSFILSWGRW